MYRLEEIAKYKTNQLEGKRIVITGCGYKPINHRFYDITSCEESHDPLLIDREEVKMNIGTAIAGVLALNRAIVHMVSNSEDKLRNIKRCLDFILDDETFVEYSAVNLMDLESVKQFVGRLPTDKTVYWVQ